MMRSSVIQTDDINEWVLLCTISNNISRDTAVYKKLKLATRSPKMIVLHLLITMLITTQRIAAFATTRLQISKSRHKVVPFASDLTKLHSTNSGSQPIHYYIYTQLDDNVGNLPCRRDLQHVLATIEKAAYSAGEVTLATAGKIAIKATKANIRDLVTESDFQCQALIKEIIMSEFPGDFFLGEEDVDVRDIGGEEMTTSESLMKALGVAIPKDDGDDFLLFVVVSLLFLCQSGLSIIN